MPEHFYFRLVHRDIEKRMIQCRALHIMAAIMMVIYSLQFLPQIRDNWIQVLAIFPPAILIIVFAVFKKKIITDSGNNRIFRILEAGILLMGSMAYLKTSQFFPAILFAFVAFFLVYVLYIESRLFTKQFIDVTKAGVSVALPTHNKKTGWSDIRNIVVKNDYFTLETQTNQIRQYPVFNSLTDEESVQFLHFCDLQLKQH